jgi:hypothetical protein
MRECRASARTAKAMRSAPRFSGKVCEIFYDCFGDFTGFVLRSCSTERAFPSTERVVVRAQKSRGVVSVVVAQGTRRIVKIVVRRGSAC